MAQKTVRLPYSMNEDPTSGMGTISVTFPGGETLSINKQSPYWDEVRRFLLSYGADRIPEEQVSPLRARMEPLHFVSETLSALPGFEMSPTRKFLYRGEELPTDLQTTLLAAWDSGDKKVFTAWSSFWTRLSKNPSFRSVRQLFSFLKASHGLAITPEGYLLAYKGVTSGMKDVHSGKFDNTPGKQHTANRNKVSDDPKIACAEGFHVGDHSYASSFGAVLMTVFLDPADVVCVPNDSSQRKVRCCNYWVIGKTKKAMKVPVIDLRDRETVNEFIDDFVSPDLRSLHMRVSLKPGMPEEVALKLRRYLVDVHGLPDNVVGTMVRSEVLFDKLTSEQAIRLQEEISPVYIVVEEVRGQIPKWENEVSQEAKKISALAPLVMGTPKSKMSLVVQPSPEPKKAPVAAPEPEPVPEPSPEPVAAPEPVPAPTNVPKAKSKAKPKSGHKKDALPPSGTPPLSREELRKMVSEYKIQGASKLGANHLRFLMEKIITQGPEPFRNLPLDTLKAKIEK